MNKPKIYVDGQAGTTGLEIVERLKHRQDLTLLLLEEKDRRNPHARKKMMEAADLVFLCLPDPAANEAAEMMAGMDTKIIDASTAHRTEWVYGFPELCTELENDIRQARKVANPGCHASGFIALVYPLVQAGLLKKDAFLSCFSLTGYTGGGKKMIAEYEQEESDPLLDAPRLYGLELQHKHLKEMKAITGLEKVPAFLPVVDDFPRGMSVSIPVAAGSFTKAVTPEELRSFYASWYGNQPAIEVVPEKCSEMISACEMAGKDSMKISVNGNNDILLLNALFDNLGKGASGAAIENMNLMLDLDRYAGLHL